MISRRKFLQSSSLVSLSPVLPCIFGSTARAVQSSPDDRVLVVIQLDGGNDGINTIVPFGDDGYGRARRKLRLKTDKLFKLDGHVGLHPNMRAAKELFDDGRLAIIQGVGYPNPNRSHFRSMKIWQTARFDAAEHDGYGWLGRALDQDLPKAKSSGAANAIFVGEQETPVALWGRRSVATALARADDLKLQLRAAPEVPTVKMSGPASADVPGRFLIGHQTEKVSLHQFVSKQVLSAYAAADEFECGQVGKTLRNDSSYPDTQLGERLKLISQLLKSGSQTRVYYTVQSGYDTHSAQLYTHARLLREFTGAVKSFLDDLKAAKLDDRVAVLAFSEFGRRVKENDSRGTDHGTAGPVFLAGSSVSAGLIGRAPDLTDLASGDLKMRIDFRQVYTTILDQWLDIDPQRVLGESFDPLALFSA